jgi:hypothetical protein
VQATWTADDFLKKILTENLTQEITKVVIDAVRYATILSCIIVVDVTPVSRIWIITAYFWDNVLEGKI